MLQRDLREPHPQAASAAASAAPALNLVEDLTPWSAACGIGPVPHFPPVKLLGLGRRQRDISGSKAVPQLFDELQAFTGTQPGNVDASSTHGPNIGKRESVGNRGVERLTDRA